LRAGSFHSGSVGRRWLRLPHARLGLSPEIVLDAGSVEALGDVDEPPRAERHVIENAAAFCRQLPAGDDVEDGAFACVEPSARKPERRAWSFAQAEQPNIERSGSIEIVRKHGEMVHFRDGHGNLQRD
jgi:hypothetical protein